MRPYFGSVYNLTLGKCAMFALRLCLIYTGLVQHVDASCVLIATEQERKATHSFIPVLKEMPEKLKPLPNDLYTGNLPDIKTLTIIEDNTKVDPRSAFPFVGGETSGLERLHHYLWKSHSVETYKETRNGLLGVDYSTKFSPWLAIG